MQQLIFILFILIGLEINSQKSEVTIYELNGKTAKEYSTSILQTKKIAEKLKLFTLAESLGGVESLCCHPASMTHASISPEEREKSGLVESLLRLSVGIEDVEDLIDDLNYAIG